MSTPKPVDLDDYRNLPEPPWHRVLDVAPLLAELERWREAGREVFDDITFLSVFKFYREPQNEHIACRLLQMKSKLHALLPAVTPTTNQGDTDE